MTGLIDSLQAEKCYYGILLPTLVSVKKRINTLLIRQDIVYCKPILNQIINRIEKRFATLFDVNEQNIDGIIAAISHPAFKGRWLSSFSKEDQRIIHTRFIEAVSKEALNESSTASVEKNPNFDFGSPDDTIDEFQPSMSQGEVTAEVTRYLKNSDCQLSILERFPEIRKTFLRYNTPLPSSASVERLFSNSTMLNLPKYDKLNDQHFEQRVLAKVNLKKNN